MEKIYEIKKISADKLSGIIRKDIPSAEIDCFSWDENGCRPKAQAQVFIIGKEFHVRLRAYETVIVAKGARLNDYVCKDSCVEFFFNPDPDHDNRYINFEFNPLGTPYLSIGTDRYGRKLLAEKDRLALRIRSSVTNENIAAYAGPFWEIEYVVPFPFLEEFYGKIDFIPGKKMKGNFYKCGDDTAFPHYGCWNPVVWDKPDFHRPEFFGDLLIV